MEKLLWFVVYLTASLAQVHNLTSEEIEQALNYGFNKASKKQLEDQTNARGKRDVSNDTLTDTTTNLHFGSRSPSQVSVNHSCLGIGFLEASKFLQKKFFQGVNSHQLKTIFEGIKMDAEMCDNITQRVCGVTSNQTQMECSDKDLYRSYNGSCNNLQHPLWGSSNTPNARFLQPEYGDGVNSLRGSDNLGNVSLPCPRKVSTSLQDSLVRPDLRHVNMMVMQWGQLLSHDLSLVPEAAVQSNGSSNPISCCDNGDNTISDDMDNCIPIDTTIDPFYQAHGKDCMRFVRSLVASKGFCFGAREQVNMQTSFVDASMIYGATEYMGKYLRSLKGGALKSTFMGGSTFDYMAKKRKCKKTFPFCFESGDGRVDEAAGLSSVHTLFHRLHNTLVSMLSQVNPHWEDETLFQEGRRIVSALWQQITYKEYLPLIVGEVTMKNFSLEVKNEGYTHNYSIDCNPSSTSVFSTAAFRFGHSMIKEHFRSGSEMIPLQGNFFNVSNFLSGRTCPSRILAGLIEEPLGGNDPFLPPVLSQHLFAPFEEPAGLDLMALNIQRGRDHGLPGYLEWRLACNLSAPTDFNELESVMNADYAQAFKKLYKNVSDIDLFPAGLAEYPMEGALVGPTFACIIGQQFQNTKFGDRFWYEDGDQPKPFTPGQLAALRKVSFSTILCLCSGLIHLQPQAFKSHFLNGNNLKPCYTYEPLDLMMWKE